VPYTWETAIKTVTTQEAMMDEEEGTTKYAKGAKKEVKILFKDGN